MGPQAKKAAGPTEKTPVSDSVSLDESVQTVLRIHTREEAVSQG